MTETISRSETLLSKARRLFGKPPIAPITPTNFRSEVEVFFLLAVGIPCIIFMSGASFFVGDILMGIAQVAMLVVVAMLALDSYARIKDFETALKRD